MDSKDIERLRTHIENRIGQLKQHLEHGTELVEKKRQQDDEAANLDLTINAEVDSTLLDNFRVELGLLLCNLQWLASEEAGYCDLCGESIPVKRLLAVPYTRRCIDCAQNPNID